MITRNIIFSVLIVLIFMACDKSDAYKADQYFIQGKYELALKHYNEHLKMRPRHLNSIYNKGRCYEELEQYDKAVKSFRKVLDLDPKNVNALLSMGQNTHREKDYEQAIFYYDKAIKEDPNNYYAYYLRGVSKHLLCNTKEAMNDYNKSINLNKEFGEVYMYRGALYLHLERKALACADFRTAQNLEVARATNALKENCG